MGHDEMEAYFHGLKQAIITLKKDFRQRNFNQLSDDLIVLQAQIHHGLITAEGDLAIAQMILEHVAAGGQVDFNRKNKVVEANLNVLGDAWAMNNIIPLIAAKKAQSSKANKELLVEQLAWMHEVARYHAQQFLFADEVLEKMLKGRGGLELPNILQALNKVLRPYRVGEELKILSVEELREEFEAILVAQTEIKHP